MVKGASSTTHDSKISKIIRGQLVAFKKQQLWPLGPLGHGTAQFKLFCTHDHRVPKASRSYHPWPLMALPFDLGSCLIQLVISTTRQAQPQHAQPQGMLVKLLPHVVTCCHRGVQQHLSRPLTHVPNCPSPTPFHPVHAPASPCWSCRGELWPGTARGAEKWPGWLWAMGNQRSGRAFLAMSVESGGLICAFY